MHKIVSLKWFSSPPNLKARFTAFITRNTKFIDARQKMNSAVQTANFWLSCTEYVISAGLFWWIG